MKRFLKIFLVVIGLLSLFILYTFYSTGFFRQVVSVPVIGDTQYYDLPGVEDMAISRQDRFLLLSSADRSARRDGKNIPGGVYWLDLKNENAIPINISKNIGPPIYPHGISLIKTSDGPYKLFVVNHPPGKHSIEVYKMDSTSLEHLETLEDASMISPNDIVAVDADRFYFTNDHGYSSNIGRLAEDYLGLNASNVVYFDGTEYNIVAENIAYANGILHDSDRELLYVASPRDFELKVYSTTSSGTLIWKEDVYIGSGIDNLEFDENGNIWTGSHPNLLRFSAYAAGKRETSPSEVISIHYKQNGKRSVRVHFLDDGQIISASTVAIPYMDQLFIGNVMDDHFIRIPIK